MFNLKPRAGVFAQIWRGQADDFITALVWQRQQLLIATASGYLGIVQKQSKLVTIQEATGFSLDVLALSSDRRFLAAAGRGGQVLIWQYQGDQWQRIQTIATPAAWIDRLAWQPNGHLLAIGVDTQIWLWDADRSKNRTTLEPGGSVVSALCWHPSGTMLVAGGYRYLKVWSARNWQMSPLELPIEVANLSLAWSPCGEFLAAGTLERMLLIWAWGNPDPWHIKGFPGKVKQLAWSTGAKRPLLATYGGESVVVCQQSADRLGWDIHPSAEQLDPIRLVEFQPAQPRLVSADDDGNVYLWRWQNAIDFEQPLTKFDRAVAAIAWSKDGKFLAVGDEQDTVEIWQCPH
jgi:WD40 repeat protein